MTKHKGIAIPSAPRYLAIGWRHMRANMPGAVPWPCRPPYRPIDHSTHMSGIPSSSRAAK